MPTSKTGGAHAYVTGTMRSTTLPFIPTNTSIAALNSSFLDSSPEIDLKSYSVYPPSPPSSAPSSPSSIASDAASIRSVASKSSGRYTNPLHAALGGPPSPIKPLLTPRNSQDGSSVDEEVKNTNILTSIFPKTSPIHQLPATKVELAEIVESWEGAVLENPAMGTRTLYVSGGSYESVNMRESICDVLELAEEKLGATGVVMVLEKESADIGELIHQLLYVGGTITSSPFAANPDYILVALDLM